MSSVMSEVPAENMDTYTDESCSVVDETISSAEDVDLAWIPGESGSVDSDTDHEEDAEEKGGERKIQNYMTSTLSNLLVCDLANRQQHQEQEEGGSGEGVQSSVVGASSEEKEKKEKVCCICGDGSVYTCPGCGARTCSIICVRVHKAQFKCTGERSIAKKIPLSEFTDIQLQRDYHFLEDVRQIVSNCDRGFSKFWRYTFRALPPPLHALREAAKKRGVVCQITSEGMVKRDANTSRFDRKTETIVWRCQFNFHSPDFTVATDWGSERHRLGDIVAYCWATNPPLPCFHINRQYNRASKWIGTAVRCEGNGIQEEEGVSGKNMKEKGEVVEEMEQEVEQQKDELGYRHQEEDHQTMNILASQLEERNTVKDTAKSDPLFLDKHAQGRAMWSPCQVQVVPLSTVEQANERAVADFLQMEPVVILARAERLGMQRKYFRMAPSSTLNEALRTLFFVNEFPVFEVIHESELDTYPLVTEADKETIRESFRAAPRPMKSERRLRRTRADLTPEEAERCEKVPCRMFLAGCCKLTEGECPYWHCTYREVPACRSFVKFASCEKGDRCSFRHDPAAVGAARKRAREERQQPHNMKYGRPRGS